MRQGKKFKPQRFCSNEPARKKKNFPPKVAEHLMVEEEAAAGDVDVRRNQLY